MTSISGARSALILGLAVCGVFLTSCGTPDAASPPPAPPPAPAAFSLSPAVIDSAAAYEAYMAKAAQVSPDFRSGEDVAHALALGENDDPHALLRGEIAYAAIAALQDPGYVATVRAYAFNDAGRRQLAGLLESEPRYVLSLQGSDTAAGLAIAALMDQGLKLKAAGAAVTQAAYDIQHQAWSREAVPDRASRLSAAEGVTGISFTAEAQDAARLQRAATGAEPLPLSAAPASQPYPPVVIRGLAVAALAILGEAGQENEVLFAPLLTETAGAKCLSMAKLNLYQCLAVSKPYYEDVFCLGEHILSDTGQCVMIDAGAPVPPPPSAAYLATPTKVAPTHPAGG
jgi:hypothetical protein